MVKEVSIKIVSKIDYEKLATPPQFKILVGFPADLKHPYGKDNQSVIATAELAKMLYYGVPKNVLTPIGTHGIKPRKFLTDPFSFDIFKLNKGEGSIEEFYENLLKIKDSASKYTAANKLGAKMTRIIKKFILSDFYKSTADNAPITIAYKAAKGKAAKGKSGSTKPLIDEGILIGQITHVIKNWVKR